MKSTYSYGPAHKLKPPRRKKPAPSPKTYSQAGKGYRR